MDIESAIVNEVKRAGIPVLLVLLIAAGIFIYFKYKESQLTNLQIKQLKKQLGE